ncbi:MAG: hypothetical protein AAF467_23045 [Actinomycetota bacterium]
MTATAADHETERSPTKPSREYPQAGDTKPEPHPGRVYCVTKFYNADDVLLYVGGPGEPLPHQAWFREVVRVKVEHLPPGTTEWEAKLYERSQIEHGTRYNRAHNPLQAEATLLIRQATDRAESERAMAETMHKRHDGTTRVVEPMKPMAGGVLSQPEPPTGPPLATLAQEGAEPKLDRGLTFVAFAFGVALAAIVLIGLILAVL